MLSGLRVDVDTLRGTERGVPSLLDALRRHGIRATFFFSVGPDNMGRHLWRLLKPAFLWKMIRTAAPSLYGWSILRCGVIGTGPDIGGRGRDIIRRARDDGHEVGLHAWDHQRWQRMDLADEAVAAREIERGFDRLTDILGAPPVASAAPAWRAPVSAIAAKRRFPFAYNSDARGTDCFLPDGIPEAQPQVPVTLPTYDEMVGRNGVGDHNYNASLLERFRPAGLNVLCIHAEVEGIAKAGLFEEFLLAAERRDIAFAPLGRVLAEAGPLPRAATVMRELPVREGAMCLQAAASDGGGR
ncbi:MAG: 4-deoxy-4-formamido-L-arabinose-phosphoundecaprenol deformylase [Planctomycetes bacterium]|nr:4-deoxy-4-formamido-L-arabinose-phosphoundecaprenol deformylase [Planctomycetota bacterium]